MLKWRKSDSGAENSADGGFLHRRSERRIAAIMMAGAIVVAGCSSSSDGTDGGDAAGNDQLGSSAARSTDSLATTSSSMSADTEQTAEPSDGALDSADSPGLNGYASSFDPSASSDLYRFIDGEVIYLTEIGAGGSQVQVTDVAVGADGTIFASTFAQLLTIDPTTGQIAAVGTFSGGSVNALATLPDGQLIAADLDGDVTLVDRFSADQSPVTSFPSGLKSSGDIIAMADGTIYATATDGSVDFLLTIDVAGGSAETIFGALPDDIYGLMASNGELYGLLHTAINGGCANGEVISIDLDSGDYESVECLPFSPGGATNG